MIKAIDVQKSFSDTKVLKGVNAEFHKGKTNLIIGQSGSGKTVTLKCLVGLYNIDSGRILYDNRDISSISLKERRHIRKEIGMLFQGGALFDSMTVEENILFPLEMHTQQSKKEKINRVNFCLERVDLKGANKKYPGELSGGMIKRVAIARAIALNPKYLLCDEPNSGLDPKTANIIDKLIHKITVDFNMTTIINTHDMNSVLEIGENIVFIKDGKVEWDGNKDTFLFTDNESLNSFIYANKITQQLKIAYKKNK